MSLTGAQLQARQRDKRTSLSRDRLASATLTPASVTYARNGRLRGESAHSWQDLSPSCSTVNASVPGRIYQLPRPQQSTGSLSVVGDFSASESGSVTPFMAGHRSALTGAFNPCPLTSGGDTAQRADSIHPRDRHWIT